MKNSETPHNLRQLIEQIYKHYNRKTITREEFFNYLQKQGYTHKQAIEIYNKAAKEKIIDSGFITRQDQEGRMKKIIVVEYMTEEDWKALEELDKIAAEEEELKRILWEEWNNLTDKERAEKIDKIQKQLGLE